jgi:ribosomal RNA-processing protein 8
MFAVRGWNVPAGGLKTQTTKTEDGKPSQIDGSENSNNSKASRKRKRQLPHEHVDQTVTSKSLSDLRQTQKRKEEASLHHGPATKPGKDHRSDEKLKRPVSPTEESRPMPTKKSRKDKRVEKDGASEATLTASSSRISDNENMLRGRPLDTEATNHPPAPAVASKLTKLQSDMRQKLISSRFRHLNEALYTKPSSTSLHLFEQNPEFFAEYHEGFRRQVEAWPENPLEGFLDWIRCRGGNDDRRSGSQHPRKRIHRGSEAVVDATSNIEPLPRNQRTGICTIADLGCGKGQLAASLLEPPPNPPLAKRKRLVIRSYDLASTSPHVTACDIRELPLQDGSVDVAIFCLALMGTNWIEFIEEAYRVLRWKGECWISEVGSRFAALKRGTHPVAHSVGRRKRQGRGSGYGKMNELDEAVSLTVDEIDPSPQPTTDVSGFVNVLRRRGFQLMEEPAMGNRMFVRMRFCKALPPSKGKGVLFNSQPTKPAFIETEDPKEISDAEAMVLKPCVYKLR